MNRPFETLPLPPLRTAVAPDGSDVLAPGTCLTIPLGTHFQFRAGPEEALKVVAVTVPPWPGDAEAAAVKGPWGQR